MHFLEIEQGQYGLNRKKEKCVRNNAYVIIFDFILIAFQIYNWVPRVFNETRDTDLVYDEEREIYQKMPQSLKDAIGRTTDAKEVNSYELLIPHADFHFTNGMKLFKYSAT